MLVPYLFVAVYPAIALWDGSSTTRALAVACGAVLLVTAVALTARLEAVRQLEVVAGRQLLRGPIVQEQIPASVGGADRVRAGTFFALHLLGGGLVGVGTIIVLPSGVTLLLGAAGVLDLENDRSWQGLGPATLVLLGLGCLVAFVYGTVAIGAAMSSLAPRLLGRSPTARLAELQRVTGELSERNRLAVDLHDSVGHALSIVTVQAGAARRLLDTDREFARDSLIAVEQAASQALADLDGALAALRDDEAHTGTRRTLDDLEALIMQSEAAGLVIATVLEGSLGSLPEPLSRDAFLVVQEGLSNVLRHVGPSAVTLRVTGDDRALHLVVANPMPPAPVERRPSGGRGLRGVRERCVARGGTADAREVDGWWRLDATMPVAP